MALLINLTSQEESGLLQGIEEIYGKALEYNTTTTARTIKVWVHI